MGAGYSCPARKKRQCGARETTTRGAQNKTPEANASGVLSMILALTSACPDEMLQSLSGGRVIRRASLPPNGKAPGIMETPGSGHAPTCHAALRRKPRFALVESKGGSALRPGFGMQAPRGQNALSVPQSLRRRAFGRLSHPWADISHKA